MLEFVLQPYSLTQLHLLYFWLEFSRLSRQKENIAKYLIRAGLETGTAPCKCSCPTTVAQTPEGFCGISGSTLSI